MPRHVFPGAPGTLRLRARRAPRSSASRTRRRAPAGPGGRILARGRAGTCEPMVRVVVLRAARMLRGPSRESLQESEMESVRAWILATVVLSCGSVARAQIGGNGSDGPFTPTANVVLGGAFWPGSVFQFTTVYIPPGVTVECNGTGPVQIFSMGDIVIDATASQPPGAIRADGTPGSPGGGGGCPFGAPGGSGASGGGTGGNGGSCCGPGLYVPPSPGLGAGADINLSYSISPSRGPQGLPTLTEVQFLTELIGGSGGIGGGGCAGGGGGGGGGCLVLSAAGTILVNGVVSAMGGAGGPPPGGGIPGGGGGGGSGGAIVLRAGTSLTVSSAGTVSTEGGLGGAATGGPGRVRFESPPGTLTVAGTIVGIQENGIPFPPAQTTASTQVAFGGTGSPSVTIGGVSSLSTLAPPRPPGWVDVTVQDTWNSITLPRAFAYLPALEGGVSGNALTGGTVTVTLTATQNHWETVYVGLVLLPAPIPLPPIGYAQWIDGLIAPVIAGLNTNPSGVVTTTVPFPATPSALGLSVYLQGIDVVTPFPLLATLTNPVTVTF